MGLDFRFTLNGSVLTYPPVDWDKFQIRIYYSEDIRGVVTSFTNSLKFKGAAYNTLYSKIELNDYCDYIPFLVEYTDDGATYNVLLEANIHIVDLEFDRVKLECTAKLQDTTFSSLIFENKDFLLTTGQEVSKNGAVITKTTFIEAAAAGIYAIEYSQLLQYIVDYITDNQVEVVDNWYPTLDDYSLGAGFDERIGFAVTPNTGANGEIDVTFSRIFTGIAKLYNLNLSLVYDDVDDTFKMNIDEPSAFRVSVTAFTISGFESYVLRSPVSGLYSGVRIGDKQMQKSVTLNALEYHTLTNPVYHHDPIEIQLRGQCNVGADILDLQPDFAYAGTTPGYFLPYAAYNPFMHLFSFNTNTSVYSLLLSAYSNSVTRLSYSAGSAILLTSSFSGPTSLTNDQILSRYVLPNNSYLSTKPDTSYNYSVTLATNTVGITKESAFPTVGYQVMDWQVDPLDITDPRLMFRDDLEEITVTPELGSSNYGIVLIGSSARITTYRTIGNLSIKMLDDSVEGEIQLWFRRGGANYISTIGTFSGDNNDVVNVVWDFYFNSDDAADEIRFVTHGITSFADTGIADIQLGSSWSVTQVGGDGADIVNVDKDTYKGYEIDMSAYVSISDWVTLFRDPRKRVALQFFNESTHYAWIKDVSFTPSTGAFSGTLITDYNNLIT